METNKSVKRKIPTLVGIVVLVVGAIAGIALVGRDTGFLPRAAPEREPEQLKITNVTSNSFSVSWMTDEPTSGFLRYGTTADVDATVTDDRDQLIGNENDYITHHVTVRGLAAGQKYYFKIGSGGSRQLYDNNGQAYEVMTAPELSGAPAAATAYGIVLTPASTPAEGAIVYVSMEGSQLLSSLVKKDGGWAVPISTIRTEDVSGFLNYDEQTAVMELLVLAGKGQTAEATVGVAQSQPVETIVLGKRVDLTQLTEEVPLVEEGMEGEEATEAAEATGSGFLAEGEEATEAGGLQITSIVREGETVLTQQPEIEGKAPPGVTISISVESPVVYTDKVVVGSDGQWDWTPPDNLEPGEHTVTISYTDDQGILRTLKRSFVVMAAGDEEEEPVITASPSGTPKPSPTPTPTPPARVTQPATDSGVPESGILTPTLSLFIMGLVLIGSGTALMKAGKFY